MSILTLSLGIVLSLLTGVVSTLVYAAILWWLDRYEKEPWGLLSAAFLWGAIPAIVLSLLMEVIFDVPISALVEAGLPHEVLGSSAVAPLVEEGVKALALLGLALFFQREWDSVLDGIIYGGLVGFGFAMTENVLYFIGGLVEEGWSGWGLVVFLRVVPFGLNHAFFTGITGAALAFGLLARRLWQRWGVPLAGLGLAMGFHALHNLGATLGGLTAGLSCVLALFTDWGGVLMLVVVALLAARQEKSWLMQELGKEVERGVLTAEECALASSYRRRLRTRWQALRSGGWQQMRLWSRFFATATELAFKKRQWRRGLQDECGQKLIQQARLRLVALRRELGRPAPEGVRYCSHCGSPIPPGDEYCPQCGQSLSG